MIAKLSEGIEPVYYRRLSENEIEILDEKRRRGSKILIHKYCVITSILER